MAKLDRTLERVAAYGTQVIYDHAQGIRPEVGWLLAFRSAIRKARECAYS